MAALLPAFQLLPTIALLGFLCFLIWYLHKKQCPLVKSQHRTAARRAESPQTILDQLVLATMHRLHEVRGREPSEFANAPRIELLEGVTATVRGLADIFLAAEHQELLLRIDKLEAENDRLKQEYNSPRTSVAGAQITPPVSDVSLVQTYDGSPRDTDSPQRLFSSTEMHCPSATESPLYQSVHANAQAIWSTGRNTLRNVPDLGGDSLSQIPVEDEHSTSTGPVDNDLGSHSEVGSTLQRVEYDDSEQTTTSAPPSQSSPRQQTSRRSGSTDQESPARKGRNSPPDPVTVPSVGPARSGRASIPNVHAPAFQPATTAEEAPTSGRSSADRMDRPRNSIPDPTAPAFEPAQSPISKASSGMPSQLGKPSAEGGATQSSTAKSLKATADSGQPGVQPDAGERVTGGGSAGTEQGRGPELEVGVAVQTTAEAPAYERDIFRKQRENARRLFGPKSQAPSAPNHAESTDRAGPSGSGGS